ncbi:Ferrichrome-iron receptor [Tumidithrix helvetica PCC 7403]|uniref:TonB-dependent siderophore receptor n=1 Tax=Tumidithrix helvetica TaxID=3457545 RepID=UPI003CA7C7C8
MIFFQRSLVSNLDFPVWFAVSTLLIGLPADVQAQTQVANKSQSKISSRSQQSKPVSVQDLKNSSTTAQDLLAQTASVKITGVKVNTTNKGVEILLESPSGSIPQPVTQNSKSTIVYDIPNATLALPDASEYRATNPVKGIAAISVTQVTPIYVRISIAGMDGLPDVKVTVGANGLTLSATPFLATGDEEDIVVTGEQQNRGYRVPNASSVTGTNTPILETPFSVQVIPQDIIRDRQITQVKDAVGNVSGVTFGGDVQGRSGNTFSIRGFTGSPVLLDGFRRFGSSGEGGSQPSFEVANLERIEVLKGPASILYGAIEPGGLINLVSKKPLATPFYEVELQAGSRGFIRPRFDISGTLSDDGKVLYRVNGLFQNFNAFQNYTQPDQKYYIAPTIAWKINDQTDLNIGFEYANSTRPATFGIPAVGKGVADIPRDRIITEPSDTVTNTTVNLGYTLEHRFDPNWKLRNAFRYTSYNYDFGVVALPLAFIEATGNVFRVLASQESQNKDYTFQTNVTGEFATGDVKHTLLAGIDYVYRDSRIVSAVDFTPRFLDLFNPTYGLTKPNENTLPAFGGSTTTGNSWGFYLQDQISILQNLKLLAGIRYDTLSQKTTNIPGSSTDPGETNLNASAFTPRLGLLYQITDTLSLYGSYSQSFTPNTATTVSGTPLEPQRGRGYEFGLKADLLDKKLFATLAYFDITKQNVAVTDPNFPLFSIASGEQRSRGLEFDVSGELLPGWRIIASYAYINGEVTADTDPSNVGKKLFGVPDHSASLWTTYEIQSGDLQGLGFGLGFKYVGDRQGDLANSFSLGSYFTADAAIFYKRDNWRFALNFKNIGDIKYIESAFGTRGASNNFGDPFTVVGSVSVQF